MKIRRMVACLLALLILNTGAIPMYGVMENDAALPVLTESAVVEQTSVSTPPPQTSSPTQAQAASTNEGSREGTPAQGEATFAVGGGETTPAAQGGSAPTAAAGSQAEPLQQSSQPPATTDAPPSAGQEKTEVLTSTSGADTVAAATATDTSTAAVVPSATPLPSTQPPVDEHISASSPQTTASPDASQLPEESLVPDATAPVVTAPVPSPSASPSASAAAEASPSAEVSVSPEPSEGAVAFLFEGLQADRQLVCPGETIRWTFACEGASSIAYEIHNAQGEFVTGGGLTSEREILFQTEVCNTYTLTLRASCAEGDFHLTSSVVVAAPALNVALRPQTRYGVAGEEPIAYRAQLSGGVAPYQVRVEVLLSGAVVYADEQTFESTQEFEVSYLPTAFGEHAVRVTVVDALSASASAEETVPVAVREPEDASVWKRSVSGAHLTGDWRKDLVAVAKTQLGYTESERDFIIDEDGSVQGYTRYGHWYGSAYGEWCAMFVSFCLHYAGIPEASVPRESNCADWKSAFSSMGGIPFGGGLSARGGRSDLLQGLRWRDQPRGHRRKRVAVHRAHHRG